MTLCRGGGSPQRRSWAYASTLVFLRVVAFFDDNVLPFFGILAVFEILFPFERHSVVSSRLP